MIRIYTDGSCYPNPNGQMGAGVVLVHRHHKLEIGRYLGIGTNNIAELSAILIGLKKIKQKNRKIVVLSDSKYSINCITGKWSPKKNIHLINQIRFLIRQFKRVEFRWVKGHKNNRLNNAADRLAHKARTTTKDYEKRFGYEE